ncbi:MAG: multidrug effflux MFS transporter [Gammaproteobacteria bacterium]|nr:multidrug effflux MFS transporter [Gammaproteobacteria bacterium]
MKEASALTTTLAITLLVALGPLATDMYLPAFPALTIAFNADTSQVQQTLSIFLVGFALAQLIYGPLSDRFGRKPVLMGGLILFLFSSLAISVADSIESLTALRLLQALGGSAGPVLGRAMVRDLYPPIEGARILSYVASAMALAPAIAPILGGYMTIHLGWASIFLFLALYALLAALLLAIKIPETAPLKSSRGSFSPGYLIQSFGQLLRHPTWRWYTLSCSFVFAGVFAFLSAAPFIIINHMGYPEEQFGLFFTIIVFGYIAGSFYSGRRVRQLGIGRLLNQGAVVAALGGITMGLLVLLGIQQIWAIILPHMVYMFGVGIIMPQAIAGALAPFHKIAGSASALFGFIQMSFAALVGILVGELHDGGPLIMALVISLMGVVTWLSVKRLQMIELTSNHLQTSHDD